jgi:purine/pyrimidine-nucleoside phosphorylase
MPTPASPVFAGVTVHAKANVYFDGNVVSHTVHQSDGTKLTLGLIRPGSYHFSTAVGERMEIVAGTCQVTLDGSTNTRAYTTGESFEVPGQSGFSIAVDTGLCEYVCTFLPA